MNEADVVVVGAGPAGLAAATRTAEAGLTTLLLDENVAAGGQVWRGALTGAAAGSRETTRARAAHQAFVASGARHLASADVVDVEDEGGGRRAVLWLNRQERRLHRTCTRALVVATGASERPLPFDGWTLPGVMGVGALQAALKQGGIVPDGPFVLLGQGPLLLLLTAQLLAHGARPAAIIDIGTRLPSTDALAALPRALVRDPALVARGATLAARRALASLEIIRQPTALRAEGDGRLERVVVEAGGRTRTFTTSILAVHDGVIPNTQLSRLLGLDHVWRAEDAAFAPVVDETGRASLPGVWVAGDGAGILGADQASVSGDHTGRDVARALGHPARGNPPKPRTGARRFVAASYRAVPVTAFADDDTILCRCEGVTLGALRAAIAAGATGPNRAKTATRCGMGACQGRVCANPLTRLIAAETGRAPGDVGALRIRPPLKPLLVGDYASLDPAEAAA